LINYHIYKEVSNYFGNYKILILNPFWISVRIWLSVLVSSLSYSSDLIKLIASPLVPNLPALPTLCKYESLSDGKSL
jgi:hypothetical protein